LSEELEGEMKPSWPTLRYYSRM